MRDSGDQRRLAAVLVARPEGQLGNRIFQAATFQAAAWKMGFSLMNPAMGPYAEFFPALAEDFFCRPGQGLPLARWRLLFCRTLDFLTSRPLHPVWAAGGCAVLDIAASHDASEEDYDLCGEEFQRILSQYRLVVAKGWKFRAHAALKSRREDVVRLFTPQPYILAEVEHFIARARAGSNLLVGLHVRLGDYATWLGGRFYYGLDAYAAWLKAANALWPEKKVSFVVCSNGNVDDLLCLPGIRASTGPGAPITDLYALAACDFLIGPPSTFTLWASYYGGAPLHMVMEKDQQLQIAGFAHHNRF
ncbi:MAG: hypothetical protein RL630_950 [Verrucomicrobiota bacterium]|jgi:hypothetical protein